MDGRLGAPRRLPPLSPLQEARASLSAGASHRTAGGGEEGSGGSPHAHAGDTPPPPVWQETKPTKRAVVTEEDVRGFQHFWLANVEKKLLMVAIPKAGFACCVHQTRVGVDRESSSAWAKHKDILYRMLLHVER